jgi:hypothetical protein
MLRDSSRTRTPFQIKRFRTRSFVPSVIACGLFRAVLLAGIAAHGEDRPMSLRLGGCGGIYLCAEPGELRVEVEKQDLNRRDTRTHMRAILFGPDRSVLDEALIPDDGRKAGSGAGPVQRAVLRTLVERPGVYGLNVTVTRDRYGDHMSWGFRSNCRKFLVETSRGHRDARHEEPIVLRDPGRVCNVGFMPGSPSLAVEIDGLAQKVTEVPIFGGDGVNVATLAVSPDGRARHEFLADPSREGKLWRIHLADARATVRIDGVTRWNRNHRGGDLSLWTPDLSSWFDFHENRWLLTPYRRTVFARAGDRGTVDFAVHNNSAKSKRVRLSLEFDEEAAWPVALSETEVELGAYTAGPVAVAYRVPPEGSEWTCYIRATVLDETGFSTWSSLTLRRGDAPARKPVDLPIELKPYRHENEQFGYLPDYPLDNQVYFDSDNRPFVLAKDGFYSLRDKTWVKTTTARCPGTDDVVPIRPVGTKIAFDRDGDVYFPGRAGGGNCLFHSRDHGATFTAWKIPGSGYLDLEPFSGHNLSDRPPPLARFRQTERDPELIWRRIHDLDLIMPVKQEDGSIVMGDPIPVSDRCIGLSAHSGIPSTLVSRGDKVHIAWGEATPPKDRVPGVPTYVATIDRTVRKVGPPALVGYGPPANDIHNSPCITMDGEGYLHVLIGTHGRAFKYARSQEPNQACAGWTKAEDVGPGLRQTYVGMVCDQEDTLHLVFRLWRQDNTYFPAGYYANLAYMRKRPGEAWSEVQPLVVAPFSEYSIFYHRLTIDRKGALFLSYDYWSTFWFYRTDHRGTRRSLIRSKDGGKTWMLVPSTEFFEHKGE